MTQEIDLDDIIIIECEKHGEFKMKARDHIGENKERIAYGCPDCKDSNIYVN